MSPPLPRPPPLSPCFSASLPPLHSTSLPSPPPLFSAHHSSPPTTLLHPFVPEPAITPSPLDPSTTHHHHHPNHLQILPLPLNLHLHLLAYLLTTRRESTLHIHYPTTFFDFPQATYLVSLASSHLSPSHPSQPAQPSPALALQAAQTQPHITVLVQPRHEQSMFERKHKLQHTTHQERKSKEKRENHVNSIHGSVRFVYLQMPSSPPGASTPT
jgi:hypothetical protein